jgi:predicted RNA-binding Zn-ribbon protein involved in translation (DUF1610 family)
MSKKNLVQFTCDNCGIESTPGSGHAEGWDEVVWQDGGHSATYHFCPKCLELFSSMMKYGREHGLKLNGLWTGRAIIKLTFPD